jgi:hypothetical protein
MRERKALVVDVLGCQEQLRQYYESKVLMCKTNNIVDRFPRMLSSLPSPKCSRVNREHVCEIKCLYKTVYSTLENLNGNTDSISALCVGTVEFRYILW